MSAKVDAVTKVGVRAAMWPFAKLSWTFEFD